METALCAAELVDDLPEGWSQPCYRIVIKPTDEGDGPEAAEPECEKNFRTYDIAQLSELFENTMQLYTWSCIVWNVAFFADKLELVFAHTPSYPDEAPLYKARR